MIQKISLSKLKFQKNTPVRIKDIIIAIGWAFILGIPLFIVHMVFFDFEHAQQMGDNYLIIQSLTETIPHHPISLALWLSAIFIAAFAIRHAFHQQSLLIREQEKLALSHRQALTDGLTGIWNRSGYEQLFTMAVEQSRDQNRLFSIILGDVDGLKEFNDTHGHPAADEALKQITQIMLTQIRISDAVARYGGDEFVIFCFDLDKDGAECLVDRLTTALKVAPLSMSFGIASFPNDGKDAKTLIEKADMRLYQAKADSHNSTNTHQRNCDCVACRYANEYGVSSPLASDL